MQMSLLHVHINDLQRGHAPVQIDDKVGTVPTRFLVCCPVRIEVTVISIESSISIKSGIQASLGHMNSRYFRSRFQHTAIHTAQKE